jgi:F420-dependent oxidoreductase-like protein
MFQKEEFTMPTRPIRFGVQTGPQNTSWDDLLATWEEVEALGYDTAWTFDHFMPIFTDPTGPCLEGWITLAALAARTKRVRLGTLVTGNTYRNPALLAKTAATLDHVSSGRLEFGIGAAWFEQEHAAYDIHFPSIGKRLSMLDESLRIIKAMWTEKSPSFDGKHYRVKDALCEPKPLQKPHPPILIGGGGEKKTLRLVARHAQMWNGFGSPEVFRRKIAILADHCRAEGTDVDAIEKSVLIRVAVTDDQEKVRRMVARESQQRGLPEEEARRWIIAGNPEEVGAQVQDFVDAGVTHLIAMTFAPYGDHKESLRRFAREVVPRFRR